MKVHFTYSARGTVDFGERYQKIRDELTSQGHQLLGNELVESNPSKYYADDQDSRIQRYKDTMRCLKKCDVVVIEVSIHSLSMGYLMQSALAIGKPVIAIHIPGSEPAFASAINDEKLQILEYEMDHLQDVLSAALDYAEGVSDVRFNFFISPAIGQYLDWISKHKKIPRSVYLRTLIERDMAENDEYHTA